MPNLIVNNPLDSNPQWVRDGINDSPLSLTNLTTGRVGIGTNTPTVRLHVVGGNVMIENNIGGEINFKLRNTNASGPSGMIALEFDSQDETNSRITQSNKLLEIGYYNKFQLRQRGVSIPTIYVTEGNQNVGLLTNSPLGRLHVSGSISPTEGEANGIITDIQMIGSSIGDNLFAVSVKPTFSGTGLQYGIKVVPSIVSGTTCNMRGIYVLLPQQASNINCHGIDVIVYGAANAVSAAVCNGSGVAIKAVTEGTNSIGGFFASNGGYAIKTDAGKVVFNGKVGISIDSPNQALEVNGNVKIGTSNKILIGSIEIKIGNGPPDNNDGAPKGSIYLRTDGGTNTTLYVKTGTFTWTPK